MSLFTSLIGLEPFIGQQQVAFISSPGEAQELACVTVCRGYLRKLCFGHCFVCVPRIFTSWDQATRIVFFFAESRHLPPSQPCAWPLTHALIRSVGLIAGQISEADCKAALDGERANVALARHCVAELGGVPSMLAPFDSTNRPEEKVNRNETRTGCSSSLLAFVLCACLVYLSAGRSRLRYRR